MAAQSLVDLPGETRIFIDANVFVYHFSSSTELGAAASAFLERVERGFVHGVTSTFVVVEALHRLMILEAVAAFDVRPRDALRYLKDHPERAGSLTRHHVVPSALLRMGIEINVVEMADVEQSHVLKLRHGLLTNDALLVATMERLEITALASNDSDFERIETLTLYRPGTPGRSGS